MARSNYSTLYKSSHSVVSVETLSSSSSAVLTILYNIYLLTYLSCTDIEWFMVLFSIKDLAENNGGIEASPM